MGYGEFVKTWFRVGNKISWKLSFYELGTLLYFQKPFKKEWVFRIVRKKHEYVLNYLKTNYQYVLDRWESVPMTENLIQTPEKRYIWIMWWQGQENAPELIRKCIESIRNNSVGAEVIVIDKNNYSQYVSLPSYIIEKHKKGIISFAQLSDIMRVNLLSRNGGLWLDATIWCSKPIPSDIFKFAFWTPHTKEEKTPFVQNNRMHCFIMAGVPGSKILEYEKDFLNEYWKTHEVIIDYYLLDYSLMLAYYNLSDVRKVIDSLPNTSETMYRLVEILNERYNKGELEKVLDENLFSKLNRYLKYKKEKGGEITNYGVLFSD